MRGLDDSVVARRLAGAMARRGFDEDVIVQALVRLGLAGDLLDGVDPAKPARDGGGGGIAVSSQKGNGGCPPLGD